jgi:hypothetical protein
MEAQGGDLQIILMTLAFTLGKVGAVGGLKNIFIRLLFFRASSSKIEEKVQRFPKHPSNPPIPPLHAQSPAFSEFPTWVAHLLPLMNLHGTSLITKSP